MNLRIVASLAMVASVIAQGVTEKIAPEGDPPNGCKPDFDSPFEITAVPLADKAKRDSVLESRSACSSEGILVLRLSDGVLIDAKGRTGYISSSYQFQFDKPPQSGALYTAGFTACSNGSLALGDTTIFWQCASGTFYNLYDRWWAEQCSPIDLVIRPCGGGGSGGGSDGGVITTTTGIPVCQIDDGQVQGHTTPCTSAPTTTVSGRPPVTQSSGGQTQVPTPSASSGGTGSTATGPGSGPGSGSTSSPGSGSGPGSGAAPTSDQSAPTAAPPVGTDAAPAVFAAGGAAGHRIVATVAMIWLGAAWIGWV